MFHSHWRRLSSPAITLPCERSHAFQAASRPGYGVEALGLLTSLATDEVVKAVTAMLNVRITIASNSFWVTCAVMVFCTAVTAGARSCASSAAASSAEMPLQYVCHWF